jgi:2-amino-4-hydroxy-6-hydroxymethyldihydropteridine diphosphokinase
MYKIEIMEKILLLLGSNLGDLEKNLEKAIDLLKKNDIKIIKRSRIYRTRPWGNVDQPDFLNMGLAIECAHQPHRLLDILKNIEMTMGRPKNDVQWGPRLIDIDIVFYGSRTIHSEGLTIPHKEFFNRPFAIEILAEIAPHFIPPRSEKSLQEYVQDKAHEGSEIYRS